MQTSLSPTASPSDFNPALITRPDPKLLKYYLLVSLCAGPGFPIVALVNYFRYETMRFEFRDDGVSMSWGILFRREVHLTYRRIQDIHLTRNLVQRWFGLATVSIQTASGSALPEMSIEGILEAEALRDFLYGKMRGSAGHAAPSDSTGAAHSPATRGAATVAAAVGSASVASPFQSDSSHVAAAGVGSGATVPADESLTLLREIRDLLGQLARRPGATP